MMSKGWTSRPKRGRVAYGAGGRLGVNTEALEQIETKIAFLERANAELSEVVYRQHREIEALSERIAALAARVEAAQAAPEARTPEEERPPHY